jgi:hypothetical protein
VPFQFNHDEKIGPLRQGRKDYLNIQPVIPVTISPEWNVISRTILPIIDQHEVVAGTNQSGFGDTTQSFFLSPKKPTASGLIWGVGPVLLLPTGTDDALGARKWGLGPTGVLLKQQGPWTYGVLANHVWSVASNGPVSVNSTFLQPFVSHTTKDAWTYTLNTESTYDWSHRDWSVPINATVTKLTKIGTQRVSLGVGARYWATSPESGPHGWGARLIVTLLYPT